jgi:hypothetical protein
VLEAITAKFLQSVGGLTFRSGLHNSCADSEPAIEPTNLEDTMMGKGAALSEYLEGRILSYSLPPSARTQPVAV